MTDDDAPFLPYARHDVRDEDFAAVNAVLRSDYLTTGPAVEAFEQALAERLGAPFAVACANGTAALHLAAMALDLGPGDVAIAPSLTFVATANAARYTGAEVVFADVDADSGLLTAETLSDAIDRAGDRARAVFPVHLNGQSADMATIGPVAQRHGLAVIEDACHAIGGTQHLAGGSEAPVGACRASTMATFSFHPAKTVAAGEGGAVTCRDDALAARLRRLRSHGLERNAAGFRHPERGLDRSGRPNPWYYELQDLGFNYRMPDILCALGASQLRRLTEMVDARANLVAAYDRLLEPLSPVVRPIPRPPTGRPAWHLYPVLIDFEATGLSRATLMRRLADRGIGTQVHYIPVHTQPYYQGRGNVDLPGVTSYSSRILSLPLFSGMTLGDAQRVAEALSETLRTDR